MFSTSVKRLDGIITQAMFCSKLNKSLAETDQSIVKHKEQCSNTIACFDVVESVKGRLGRGGRAL